MLLVAGLHTCYFQLPWAKCVAVRQKVHVTVSRNRILKPVVLIWKLFVKQKMRLVILNQTSINIATFEIFRKYKKFR